MRYIKILMTASASLLLASCSTTYTISREELYRQVAAATPKDVVTKIPGIVVPARTEYLANGVKQLVVKDKKGADVSLENSPRIEMRITDNRHRKHILYFDTILLSDSTFTGMNSRFLGTRKKVRYADIAKVEVQEGKKNFHYKGE